MVRYSHVSLLVSCDTADGSDVTALLEVTPTRVRLGEAREVDDKGGWRDVQWHTWMLDSPKGAEVAPTERLFALADLIEPFAEGLLKLDPRYKRWVDIVYHVTPQLPHTITGEFDWFQLPASLMRRLGHWNLDVSYEVYWFNHADSTKQQRLT